MQQNKFSKYIGIKFDNFTIIDVIYKTKPNGDRYPKFLFKCDCGNVRESQPYYFFKYGIKQCQCNTVKITDDLIGKINNKLELLEIGVGGKGLFRCDCGKIKEMRITPVFRGVIKTCGCSITKGRTKEEAYFRKIALRRLNNMKRRCYDELDKEYKNYGARGVTICEEWLNSKEAFVEWCKSKITFDELHLTLDRIDTDGNYSPDNCRFITNKENCRNRRNNKFTNEDVYEIRYGKYKNYKVADLCKIFNCGETAIRDIKTFKTWN